MHGLADVEFVSLATQARCWAASGGTVMHASARLLVFSHLRLAQTLVLVIFAHVIHGLILWVTHAHPLLCARG